MKLIIDGEERSGARERVAALVNPATEEIFREVATAEIGDVEDAVAGSHRCFQSCWRGSHSREAGGGALYAFPAHTGTRGGDRAAGYALCRETDTGCPGRGGPGGEDFRVLRWSHFAVWGTDNSCGTRRI